MGRAQLEVGRAGLGVIFSFVHRVNAYKKNIIGRRKYSPQGMNQQNKNLPIKIMEQGKKSDEKRKVLTGFEPTTFKSIAKRVNHYATNTA